MSLVLSITAKFLEKPRSLHDSFELDTDSLSIRVTIGHIVNEIDRSDSLPAITRKALVRAQEDVKEIICSAIPIYDTQGKTSRSISDDQNGLMINIVEKIVAILDEQLKTDFRDAISDRFGRFWNRSMILAAINAPLVSTYEHSIDPGSVISPPMEIMKYKKKHQSICKILLFISDAQTMTGISLLGLIAQLMTTSSSQTGTGIALIISAMAQRQSISIYHLRLVYEIINFTAYVNCFFERIIVVLS